jgi:hypothetical protein
VLLSLLKSDGDCLQEFAANLRRSGRAASVIAVNSASKSESGGMGKPQ